VGVEQGLQPARFGVLVVVDEDQQVRPGALVERPVSGRCNARLDLVHVPDPTVGPPGDLGGGAPRGIVVDHQKQGRGM